MGGIKCIMLKNSRKKNNRGFHDGTWLISIAQTVTENPEESMRSIQKKQKVFVWAASAQGWTCAGWALSARLPFPVFLLQRLGFPCHEKPKGEDTAQAKMHCPVWFRALGKSWSQVRLNPNSAHCPSTITASPWVLLQSNKRFQKWGSITSWCPCFSLCLGLDSSIAF